MLSLNINLEKNKSYTNYWNYFSKSLLLKWVKEPFLLIVENEKTIQYYKTIFKSFHKNLKNLNSKSWLIDLIFNKNSDYVIDIDSLLKMKINLYELKKESIYIKKDTFFDLNKLIENLTNRWYKYSEYFNNWTYRKVWDLVYIISFDWETEYKISFWWDNIENIWIKEKVNNSFLKELEVDELYISSNENVFFENWKETLQNILWTNDIFTIIDCLDFHKEYESITKHLSNFCSFDFIRQRENCLDLEIKELNIDNIEDFRQKMLDKKFKTVYTKNKKLIENFAYLNNISNYEIFESNENLLKSFESNENIVFCDDVISKVFVKRRVKKSFSAEMDLLLKISSGDYIVHIDHWIWIFNWIVIKDLVWIKKEYIEIIYKNEDKLFVPITEVQRVSKYIWSENPNLTWLNSKEWEKKLEKANIEAEAIAHELLELYAQREIIPWFKFERNKEKEQIFQKMFPYVYTEWQMQAIEEILHDMNSIKNMDRLLVWDVGFWKTEVAFNAIYLSFLNKKQSVFISPLVVLAYEHYEKSLERYRNLWVRIEVLTRLESTKNVSLVLKKLASWEVDVVIWTHKLLNENIVFKNLWLIVVDEEHKFWVEDKEKIRKMKTKIDTLSMSATPIPRSLNMALSNIRDISLLKDAPIWRKNIKTVVTKFSESVILELCKNEFSRWWQVFFIHNRVENIEIIKWQLEAILPDRKVVVTHWRLTGDELENRIMDFKHKKYDVLLSTTVIENWIDFSNVNTIFINNCENFWLSQIHQLRWRVWRSNRQWFCYLLYKKENIDKDAAKRLKTIVDYSYLWAWFELAMKDLEIRWWWDILGIRQSGQNNDLGVNIFLELLEKKIYELKNKSQNIEVINTSIDLNIESYIDDKYFSTETDKINFYKEIEHIESEEDLDNMILDFKNFNYTIEKATQNLFDIIKLRIKSSKYKIESIKKVWINYQVGFNKWLKIDELKAFLVLDKDVKFTVIDLIKLRTSTKNFENDEKFLQYMLSFLENKLENKKIKLIKKIWKN